MSKFLEDLKKAVEIGEFNSEAAKKINEVNKLATIKTGTDELDKIYSKENIKSVTEEEATVINSEYEKKMLEIKEKDLNLQQIKTLIDIEETVRLSINDMAEFIQTLEESFDRSNSNYIELFTEIDKIKTKYDSIINN